MKACINCQYHKLREEGVGFCDVLRVNTEENFCCSDHHPHDPLVHDMDLEYFYDEEIDQYVGTIMIASGNIEITRSSEEELFAYYDKVKLLK